MKVVIAFILLAVVLVVWVANVQEQERIDWIIYEVQRGDTLWSIITEHNPNANRQELIYMTKEWNNITPIIQPGEVIEIPVKN